MPMFRRNGLSLILAFGAALLAAGCGRRPAQAPENPVLRELDMSAAERRHLLAQIVDHPAKQQEAAILEGKAFKYLLKACSETREGDLEDKRNRDATFEHLLRQPNLFRGEIVSVRRAVVIEVAKAPLPPEYGLPGWSVLPALLVNNTYDLYELRILVPPDSDMYEKLRKGIEKDDCPVLRVSGFFMKNHVKKTSNPQEPPWQRPLIVCPEPSIERRAGKYPAMSELRDSGHLPLLPSMRVDGPKAEERLVVEVVPVPNGQPMLRIDGRLSTLNDAEAVTAAVGQLKRRLPPKHAEYPSAVVLIGKGLKGEAAKQGMNAALEMLQRAGISRLAVKDENEILVPYKPAKKK